MTTEYKACALDERVTESAIVGYAATWSTEPDSYGDVIERGAFDSTLARDFAAQGRKIPILFDHRTDPAAYVGVVDTAAEDDKGLYIEGSWLDTPTAQHVRQLVKQQVITEMSFAYVVRDSAVDEKTNVRTLKEVDLIEVSLVLRGANPETSVTTKSAPSGAEREEDAKVSDNVEALAALEAKVNALEAGSKALPPLGEDITPSDIGNTFVNELKAAGGAMAVKTSGFARELKAMGLLPSNAPNIQPIEGRPHEAFADPVNNQYQAVTRLAHLFGQGVVSSPLIRYYELDNWRTLGINPLQEGAEKPWVQPTIEDKTANVVEIAASWEMSDVMLDDEPYLVSEINNGVKYILGAELDKAIVAGAGSAGELHGLSVVQNQTAVDFGSATSVAEGILAMIVNITANSPASPDHIVMSPSNYLLLRSAKNASGDYYAGGFAESGKPTVWGLPVVLSNQVGDVDIFVGAFRSGGTLYHNKGLRLEMTNSHGDNFRKDITTFRARVRVGLRLRQNYFGRVTAV